MYRKSHASSKRMVAATLIAIGASSAALANSSDTTPAVGESYRYFSARQATTNPSEFNRVVAVGNDSSWRSSHPNGLTVNELQALSSSALSASARQLESPVVETAAADPAWRQGHRNGLTERELQALSSSALSASADPIDASVVASAAADPSWRQSHPNGLTEAELQVLSSSSLAMFQPGSAVMTGDSVSVARAPGKETFSARLARFFRPRSST